MPGINGFLLATKKAKSMISQLDKNRFKRIKKKFQRKNRNDKRFSFEIVHVGSHESYQYYLENV